MFTGIVSDVGKIQNIEKSNAGMKAKILVHSPPSSIDIGASIACDGVCLTVTHLEAAGENAEFSADISPETLEVTNLKGWEEGKMVNIERSMRIGEEIGGHIVSGHVDGLARIENMKTLGGNLIIRLSAPEYLAKFIAAKGSVALNGTSLTVNAVDGQDFTVNLIPHSLEVTTWKNAQIGDLVNLEVDMMARYVARLREFD